MHSRIDSIHTKYKKKKIDKETMLIKAFKNFIGIEPNEEQDTKEERKKSLKQS